MFEGRILNVGHDRLTLSLEGHPDKLDDFEELLRPYGIAELQRTGRVALPKIDNTTQPAPAGPSLLRNPDGQRVLRQGRRPARSSPAARSP